MISCPYHWLHRFCGDGMIIQALRRCSFFCLSLRIIIEIMQSKFVFRNKQSQLCVIYVHIRRLNSVFFYGLCQLVMMHLDAFFL